MQVAGDLFLTYKVEYLTKSRLEAQHSINIAIFALDYLRQAKWNQT